MKHQELLQEQQGGDGNQNSNVSPSKPLFERQQIPNSPFWIIGNEEQGYNITMGKYKITPEPITEEIIKEYTKHVSNLISNRQEELEHAATTWLEMHRWDVILTMALCAITDVKYRQDDTIKP